MMDAISALFGKDTETLMEQLAHSMFVKPPLLVSLVTI